MFKLFQIGGQQDLLTNIFDLGGIRPSRKGQPENGLYDGYHDAIGEGETKLLIRRSGLAPDTLRDALNSNFGHDLESVSDMYRAIERTTKHRRMIRQGEQESFFDVSDKDPEKQERARRVFGSLTAAQKTIRALHAWETRKARRHHEKN
jgi:hypothetical protein